MGELKAPPLLSGGMIFLGLAGLETGQSQCPWRSGVRELGSCGESKHPVLPTALGLKVMAKPQARYVAYCQHYQQGPIFSPCSKLIPEKLVRTVSAVNILLPPESPPLSGRLLKALPSEPYLGWRTQEGVVGFRVSGFLSQGCHLQAG